MVLLFYVFAVALVGVKHYPPLSSNVLKPKSKKRTGNQNQNQKENISKRSKLKRK
jgi:hypothetical protein